MNLTIARDVNVVASLDRNGVEVNKNPSEEAYIYRGTFIVIPVMGVCTTVIKRDIGVARVVCSTL